MRLSRAHGARDVSPAVAPAATGVPSPGSNRPIICPSGLRTAATCGDDGRIVGGESDLEFAYHLGEMRRSGVIDSLCAIIEDERIGGTDFLT